MFIKNAYEKRLKKEAQESIKLKPPLKPKLHQIGSKNARKNYDRDEHFFSSDDVPVKAKRVHDDVKEFIDPDHLGLRKREWNPSVAIPKNPLAEETFERKMIKIRLGLLDHPVPVEKDKIIPLGTDTRNHYGGGWDVSTQQDLRERKRQFMDLNEEAKLATTALRSQHLKTYKTILEKQLEHNEKLRQIKIEEKEFRDQIRKEYKFRNPGASKEKTDGAVFRLAYEKKLNSNKKEADDPNMSLGKPDLSQTLKEYKQSKYYHTGVWQDHVISKPPKEGDPNYSNEKQEEKSKIIQAWSCCQNQDPNSEGCNKVIIDKYKWRYDSYT